VTTLGYLNAGMALLAVGLLRARPGEYRGFKPWVVGVACALFVAFWPVPLVSVVFRLLFEGRRP
jgi:hypothetical protein